MAPPSYHPDSVTVTLRTSKPVSISNPSLTRNIILRPEEPITVGRSSRSEAKNLSPAFDNALFDCPVISRRHATLVLRLNRWAEVKHQIELTDTNSMHGTSVNGVKLQPSKPFTLRVGDKVRLGDSVNRAENNYDGVAATIECISTATQKSTAQSEAQSSQHGFSYQKGFSYPSESELGFDDDEDDDEENVEEDIDEDVQITGSSTHVTPDQPNTTVGYGTPSRLGYSLQDAITLDEDNDEGVTGGKGRAFYVPDTYADESLTAAVAARPAHAATSKALDTYSLSESDDGDGDNSWTYEDQVPEESDNGSQISDEDSISRADADNDSRVGMHAATASYHDRHAVQDDDEDDEGPEVMTSRRAFSVEIGTLGDEQDHVTYEAIREAAVPRPRYDPVRGFQVAPAVSDISTGPAVSDTSTRRPYDSIFQPAYTGPYADFTHSSKWDVESREPTNEQIAFGTTVTAFGADHSNSAPYFTTSPDILLPVLNKPIDLDALNGSKPAVASAFTETLAPRHESPVTFPDWHSGPREVEPSIDSAGPFALPPWVQNPAEPSALPSSSRKRKADKISGADQVTPLNTDPTTSDKVNVQTKVGVSCLPPFSNGSGQPLVSERLRKKRKTERAQSSMLRTAVIEIGKYTAGAIIGGIGLVTLLASPIGEALASC